MSKDFTFTISAEQLTRGLRPSKRAPRDSKFLVEAKGAIGQDGVLCAIDELSRLTTAEVTDTFPFPQLFVFTNLIIVCGRLKIYELVSGSLSLKYTATTGGSTWTAVDFYKYVYLSNGREAVTRNPDTGVYSLSSTLPKAMSLCNFNGQVLVGAPDASVNGASLSMQLGSWTATTSLTGTWGV